MAGARKPTPRERQRARSLGSSPSAPTSTFTLRHVRRSQGLSVAQAAKALGIDGATLRRWATAGKIPASVDERGHYHFSASSIASRSPRFAEAQRRTKRKLLGQKKRPSAPASRPRKKRRAVAPPPVPPKPSAPAKPATSAPSRKKKLVGRKTPKSAKKSKKVVTGKKAKKKRAGKKPPRPEPSRKKKQKKRRAKKSKRPRRPPPPPPPPELVPGRFGVPIRPPGYQPPPPTAAEPMSIDLAAKETGELMRDYIMARFKWEREATHLDFYAAKHSFRETYGLSEWHDWFDWIVDEWDLEPYIFDRTALRDS